MVTQESLLEVSGNEEDEPTLQLLSKKELRCKPLVAALKCSVALTVSNFYQVVAIRVLSKQQGENSPEIWCKRQVFEENLKREEKMVGFFSCPTALQKTIRNKKVEVPGMAFWVMFDWPEYGIVAYENHLTQLFFSLGVTNIEAKAVKARSKRINQFLKICFVRKS